jgi:hypothetical protein
MRPDNRPLMALLAALLLLTANQLAWSQLLDGPQGGHGDVELVFAVLLSLLAAVVVAITAVRRGRPAAAGAAPAVAIAMFGLAWCLGAAAPTLLRSYYCSDVRSPGQCLRCFTGDEQQRRCGG